VHDPAYLEIAIRVAARMRDLFEDTESGGFYSTASGDANLILRVKEDYDGAEPSGNSMAVYSLLRLSRLAHRDDFRASAERALAALADKLSGAAAAVPQLLCAYLYSESPPAQIVISAAALDEARPLLRTVHTRFLPFAETAVVGAETREALARVIPEVEAMRPVDSATAAYVCENFACQAPVTSESQLEALVK
jgi:uncharacterized protein YyaL (SSP411 family)